MSSSSVSRTLYLATEPDPVLGRLHLPAGTPAPAAVVLVPPFGWEAMASHRGLREWVAMLGEAGVVTLWLDLPGTGDSAGDPRAPGRLDAWTDAVGAGAAWLRTQTGATRVAALGLGLGGLLACRAMTHGHPIDDLVLWAAPARGRGVVRELRAFARMEEAWQLSQGGLGGGEPLPDGFEAAGGYVMSADTVVALEGLDVSTLALPEGGGRRALLLERDGMPVDPRLEGWLVAGGVAVTEASGEGYGDLITDPELARIPTEAFRRVTTWVAELPATPAGPPAMPAAPEASDTLRLTVDGFPVTETPMSVDRAAGQLRGILAEPAPATPASSPAPCLVLLNAGSQRRIGPNRMWVELARRWAARGMPSLRIDLESIGDADGRAGPWTRTADFYVPSYVDQVREALDALERRGVADRFIVAGKCSGAYWSLHAAIQDERIVSAFMLNPKLLIWDGWNESIRDTQLVRERLTSGGSWRRVVRREVPLSRVVELAGSVSGRVLSAPVRIPSRLAARRRAKRTGGDALDHAFDALRDSGTRGLLLFAGREPLYEELEAEGRLRRLEQRWPNVRLERISLPVDTHTLRPIWLQHRVHRLLDQALERELAASSL